MSDDPRDQSYEESISNSLSSFELSGTDEKDTLSQIRQFTTLEPHFLSKESYVAIHSFLTQYLPSLSIDDLIRAKQLSPVTGHPLDVFDSKRWWYTGPFITAWEAAGCPDMDWLWNFVLDDKLPATLFPIILRVNLGVAQALQQRMAYKRGLWRRCGGIARRQGLQLGSMSSKGRYILPVDTISLARCVSFSKHMKFNGLLA